jgi:hypothetical protein
MVLGLSTAGAVPMDGGDVVLTGIGFAASAFLTCATVPPDPAGYQAAAGGAFFFADGTHSYASADNVVLSPAAALPGLATVQVRFRRYRFPPTGELEYNGIRREG